MRMASSTYTPEKADAIIDLIDSGVWVTEACRQVGVPCGTFLGWVRADIDGLAERSARARANCYDVMAEETIAIADADPLPDPITGRVDTGSVQHQRLRIDTRFRLLGKLAPHRYGDKLALEHGGQVAASITVVSGIGRAPDEPPE